MLVVMERSGWVVLPREALAAVPEDPWLPRLNSSIGVKCYACGWLAMHREEGKHAEDCPWAAYREATR
jgi:hypothetical protein